jgi:rhamnosyltransferase
MLVDNLLAHTSLFIPTYNAATGARDNFITTLQTIKSAGLHRVLIIDSSSTDDTQQLVNQYGFELVVISKQQFDHSATRQLAYNTLSDSQFIIYITQDVLLDNKVALSKLIAPLTENAEIAGVYGRQLPHSNADIFAEHLRYFNYGKTSYIYSYSDRFIYGIKSVFCSNSFAAYRVTALDAVGGFAKRLILGEDVYLFAKFLQHDFKVAYVADAICQHSHNYSLIAELKRYFDIGVFYRTQNWIINDFGHLNKQGLQFIISEVRFIKYRFWYYPKMIIKILIKYIGYKLGYNFDVIGVKLCRKLSTNSMFWW